ncbi:hypothetical protein M3Y94_00189300 [Aphelenchoides besseyi]|nr:hypothetical protein M3Y94_00189300 [Aphelenchoides besseyi]
MSFKQTTLKSFFESAPVNNENRTPRSTEKRPPKTTPKRKRKADDNQTILDVGQKNFGLELCTTCGMTYNLNHESDVKLHEEYHNRFKSTKSFHIRQTQLTTWKKQLKHQTITVPMEATILILDSESSSTLRQKVESIITNYINPELGFCDDVVTWKKDRLAAVFVVHANEKIKCPQFIASIVLVDPIDSAILLPDNRKLCGSFVGVNRLWVHESMRRRGVATMLLNVCRQFVYPKAQLSKVLVAFDEPEGDALNFVVSYTKQKDGKYLIYSD